MADDWCCKGTDPSCDGSQECVNRAALLIEAQQAEIERLRAERDAERALADRLVHLLSCFHLSQRCRAPQGTALEDWCSECAAIAAYEEARRG